MITQGDRDGERYMLVPLTPYEAMHAMAAIADRLHRKGPDAVLATTFAWLRDSNREYLEANPDEIPHLRELAELVDNDFFG